MNKTLLLFAGVAVLSAAMAGCTNIASFDYQNTPDTMVKFAEPGTAGKSVAVLPFLDQRGMKYLDPGQAAQAAAYPAGDRGSFYLGLIPLVPFGAVEKEVPEKSDDFVSLGRFHFDPAQDLATASVQSLKSSNLFSQVTRANSLEQADADYVWQGSFTNTCYRGKLFSYGITYFLSPGLWLLGAPSGVSDNELWVNFALIEKAGGKTVWEYSFRGKDYIVHWIYARVGEDVSLYPRLMKRAMNGALFELRDKLPAVK